MKRTNIQRSLFAGTALFAGLWCSTGYLVHQNAEMSNNLYAQVEKIDAADISVPSRGAGGHVNRHPSPGVVGDVDSEATGSIASDSKASILQEIDGLRRNADILGVLFGAITALGTLIIAVVTCLMYWRPKAVLTKTT